MDRYETKAMKLRSGSFSQRLHDLEERSGLLFIPSEEFEEL